MLQRYTAHGTLHSVGIRRSMALGSTGCGVCVYIMKNARRCESRVIRLNTHLLPLVVCAGTARLSRVWAYVLVGSSLSVVVVFLW